MQNLKLTDLIDISILQKFQDAFSKFVQMSSLTADENGVAITEGSNFTRFCNDLTRKSELGCKNCEECDKLGGINALKNGKPTVYRCHAGLIDFAAPIIVDDCILGSFMGGQVCTKPIDEDFIRRKAVEYGIDEEAYISAARDVKLKDEDEVQRAAQFLTELAEIISEMAYENYKALKNSRKLEKAACSQAAFIIEMNSDLQKNIKSWLLMASHAAESGDMQVMKEALETLMTQAPKFLASIEDTVEYAKMTDGGFELDEEEYNVRKLFGELTQKASVEYKGETTLQIDSSVPEVLFGDAGRIRQAVVKLLRSSYALASDGKLSIRVSCSDCGYAVVPEIRVSNTGGTLTSEKVSDVNETLESKHQYLNSESWENIGLTVTGRIIRQMHGTISAEKNESSGFDFVVKVPQLNISCK